MPRRRILIYLGSIVLLLAIMAAWYGFAFIQDAGAPQSSFDGQRALRDVQQQVEFGPRTPGSEAHQKVLTWMQAELAAAGWTTRIQASTAMGHPVSNLIAFRTSDPPRLLLAAHFDSRLWSDRDSQPGLRQTPTPGADDGASGVAVLLELARTLPPESVPMWLVFFDAEDNGRIPGWDWILGSRAFVSEMDVKPEKMVLLDMVGDRDLGFKMEGNSDPDLAASIWQTAARLGYSGAFETQKGSSILDDHVPFLEAGIPAVDIIDIDYPYWHTTEDTPDKLASESLQTVGDVLWTWLVEQSTGERTPGK